MKSAIRKFGADARALVPAVMLCLIACREERAVLVLADGSDAGRTDADVATGLRVVVSPNKVIRQISPLIYGFHLPDGPSIQAVDYAGLRPTLLRIAGFRPTTYNWELNASNGGVSWCSENASAIGPAQPLGFVDAAADTAEQLGATLVIPVPLSAYVSGDTNGGSGPPGCTGDVRKTPNYLASRFVSNLPAAPIPLAAAPDVTDARVYQDQMAAWLRRKHPTLPVIFELDRYPDRWTNFHPALFPQPVGFDDLCARSIKFATAIKAVWPEAIITGPGVAGWSGLVALGPVTERGAKGDFFAYYLRCLENAKPKSHLLNAFQLAWTSEASAGGESVGGAGTSAAVVKARVQAPRTLWDPSYVDDSAAGQSEGALRLIPRLTEAIDSVDPQVGIFISEWSFGGTDHPSGAIAVADALGVYGRLGVRMAVLRWHQEPQRFSLGALRLFRNFDNNGGAFGDTAVQAVSSNIEVVTAYASKDGAGLYVVIINKDQTEHAVELEVADSATGNAWHVFRIDAGSAMPLRAADVTGQSPMLTLPALSVSLLHSPSR